jgi:hypothetical protein
MTNSYDLGWILTIPVFSAVKSLFLNMVVVMRSALWVILLDFTEALLGRICLRTMRVPSTQTH